MGNLKVGDKAPDFKSIDQDGNDISLDQFKGKRLFYTSTLKIILRVVLWKRVI